VKVSQSTDEKPKAVALIPLLDQGDIAEKPKPTPKINRTKDSAAAPEAPAKIALHDTPDEVVSHDTSNKFRSVVVIVIPICVKP
jgi:hypothetical protein